MTTLDRVKNALLATQRHSWEQGVAAQAFLELGNTELVVQLAQEAATRQAEDGRLGIVGENHAVTDPAAVGEAMLLAARVTGDARLGRAAERMLDYLLYQAPRAADGTWHHVDTAPELWVDSLYMGPPFVAVAGRPDEAVRQIEGLRRALWNPDRRLFAHIWDAGSGRFVRAAHWGVGNGWAAAGLVRVIRALPGSMAAERDRLIRYAREVIDGCLAHRRDDWLYHDVVDDPATFVESNLAQMLAYSIYRGLEAGWLDTAYRVHAESLRAAVHRKVDARGWVRDVCGAPRFDHPGTAPEGQAFFLLMEAARRDGCAAR